MTGGRPAPGLVVLGGSWGGLDASCRVLSQLAEPLPVPVLLVLHRAKTSDPDVLATVMLRCSGHRIAEVEDKTALTPGTIHLAPPDYHVLVDAGDLALSVEPPVHHSRPSIDLAFETAADELGGRVVGVLLSGAGSDGAEGLRRIRDVGGRVLVQSPTTAERGEMPAAGLVAVPVPDLVGTPEDLGRHLAALLSAPDGEGDREGTA